MTDELTKEDSAPKTKEQMRDVPHEYVDANGNNDWCAVCGRSEGWQAHKIEAEAPVDDGAPVDEPATQDSLDTEPLEPPDDLLP